MIEEKSTSLEEKILEKTPTGINGLDEITEGGIAKRSPNPGMWKCRLG